MKILVDENDFGNAVCKTAAILSQPQCVNDTRIYIIKNVPDQAVTASPATLNSLWPTEATKLHRTWSTLLQVKEAEPQSEHMLTYCQLNQWAQTSMKS